ncbi:vacuolar protein sorting-associated protein 54 [Episyrphus balteatus]|uniref:vacuolar protein sorting-associated protein 54 n=1 Tax=Episyrphus balteatus TaxID=286459 RepID=UPI002484F738|nr:vacuolar protein sorting-associated protein 54 [Episyrphus balteatus]
MANNQTTGNSSTSNTCTTNNNEVNTNIITKKDPQLQSPPAWESCYYCPMESFKSSSDFVKHLRERHCTKEGGSYVCRYGFNGVCPSLPLDGVSDRDYESHVTRYHVNQPSREPAPEWSVFSAAQNLPAVLNDPGRGKQANLFTKKWGDSFVEKVQIGNSPHLDDIQYVDFENYVKKIGKRYRRHVRMSAHQLQQEKEDSSQQNYRSPTREGQLSEIPDIFMKASMDLNNPQTFGSVFPGIGQANEESKQSGRLLQEKLSHYLDIVEVKIARQVSQKSAAFFHAMTSQDAIMEQMQEAAANVRELRESLRALSKTEVVDSLKIVQFAQRRRNYDQTLDKLCLMATVHKTQPMLQLLLGTQDYVAALDLIGTTQEILTQELVGVHCFKHLPMQLTEMEKLIDKMLTTEFERFATADLNRPLSSTSPNSDEEFDKILAEDKLICIVMGLLRKNNYSFIDTYKEESIVTIRAIIKQLVIEVIASSDAELCLTGHGEEAQSLSITEWIALLQRATVALLEVLNRVKAVTTIMLETANAASGRFDGAVNLMDSDAFLTETDYENVKEKLSELLQSVCNYCHERCANLVSSQSLEKSVATADEIEKLTAIVNEFSSGSEAISGAQSVPLKVAVKVQASRFANRFHSERKQKMALLLDSERWRQVDIPNEFQKIIDRIAENDFSFSKALEYSTSTSIQCNGGSPASPVLLVEGKPFSLVGAALLLVQMISEYCKCALRLPIVAGYLSRNVVDLLRTFNSRSCQLIIGAGALRVAGLKTITSGNLALVSRALQLVLWLMPKVKEHFRSLDPTSVSSFDTIEKDFIGHIKEIENKIYGIVTDRVAAQLSSWDSRPPVPSQSFRNISRHLVKLHEAIAPILPEQQIHAIYRIVHKNFKDKLKEQLLKNNIINNGGPQHGVVTSELTFYMETLRTLKALPAEEMGEDSMEDIWIF